MPLSRPAVVLVKKQRVSRFGLVLMCWMELVRKEIIGANEQIVEASPQTPSQDQHTRASPFGWQYEPTVGEAEQVLEYVEQNTEKSPKIPREQQHHHQAAQAQAGPPHAAHVRD